ncbi:unnamed protein product [Penicillium egyptiacum]|uniref:Uncharacterized protein n=1 Tax=Penicillium egyptiacum TaxID=1303716 RepID=A0A9W4KMH1_9EURO|nr:unnamed protein product [Penicillium egyptiacum]
MSHQSLLQYLFVALPAVQGRLLAQIQLCDYFRQLKLVPITFDGGGSAAYIEQFRQDTAFVTLGDTFANSTNRAPGDIKVSWKWCSGYQYLERSTLRDEYNQVSSQVNFYMSQHNARHGFMLTNTELVAAKRLDGNGRLAVSRSIPWTAAGHSQLTVLTVVWSGMLATEEALGPVA